MGILKTILFIHLLFSGWCFLFLTYLKLFYKVDITKNLFYLFDTTLSSKLISKSKIYGTDTFFTIFWWSIIPGKNVKLLLVYLILAFSTEEGFFLELLKDGNKKALGSKYDEAVLKHHQIKKRMEKKIRIRSGGISIVKKDIIILINGTGGSGKSTFIKFCQNHVPIQWEVEEYSTVDWVKKVAKFCGWNGGKTEKDRAFLHNLKEILQEWDDSPNQFVEKTIEYQSCLRGKSYVFFINVREIDNLIKLKKNYENKGYFVYTLLIKNPSVPNILSNKADANVENYNYDEVIINKFDLQFLEDCAQKFMSFIIGYFSTKKDLLSN